ncbi:MAG: ABC transporter ATP-binding protein [Anaerolineaceae bacterium]|nr:ABC transporter ATP-binding protein [Anaerolineaceae bacterium]
MIQIKQLTKIYGSGKKSLTALNNISLEINAGMFGLLGPNGAGKTTLMRILAGIIHPSQGSVVVGGHNLAKEEERVAVKAMLGYLPQELGLYPDLTAAQFVDYMAILKGVHDPKLRAARVEEALEMVSLKQEARRKIKEFSGGMKRRVGIAQALVNHPRILIVDEPTAGLDPEERIRFRNLLVDLAADRVVLLSTHIVGDIGQTCQQMAILDQGRIRFLGSPAELTHQARGHVWSALSEDGRKPNHGLTVVSMIHLPEGIQYRLVGETAPDLARREAVTPGLEDGYMWLMKKPSDSED